MDLEGLEQIRADTTKQVMESMAKIATDEKVEIADRIKAAKVVDGMSDSIIKVHLMYKVTDSNDDTKKRMLKKLDDLTSSQGE